MKSTNRETNFCALDQQRIFRFFLRNLRPAQVPRTIFETPSSGDIRAGSTSGTGGEFQRKVETRPN